MVEGSSPPHPAQAEVEDGSGRTTEAALTRRGAGGVVGWARFRVERTLARVLDFGARRGPGHDTESGVELTRIGGPVARWASFPRGVRTVTAATTAGAVALGIWGFVALAGNVILPGLAACGLGVTLAAASGPIGVRLANRLHRLIARARRRRVSELRGVADRRAVAVRGVVIGRRTIASTMDRRPVVWSLTRFRLNRSPLASAFFHEVAFDFLIDDGTDEPIHVEVEGGMVIDPFPPDRRVQFQSTTLLDIDHPFLTRLRLRDRQVLAAEISVAPGDVVEVVGRLSRRLDPTAPSHSGREPPQRRALRSGTRVPVMVKKILEPDLELARVRRLPARGAADASAGEPPLRRF
ncbi:MAG TPA: hypothetical protein VHU40_12870 [Polyangia bacterium]|nr:hypothetical protein [Polyangia bacterium]